MNKFFIYVIAIVTIITFSNLVDSHLQLYMEFENNLVDQSIYNHSNGIFMNYGNSSNYTTGKFGQGYASDNLVGVSNPKFLDKIYIASNGHGINFSSGGVTFQAWIKLNEPISDSCAKTNLTDINPCSAGILMTNNHRFLLNSAGGFESRYKNTSGNNTAYMGSNSYLFTPGIWYHVASTFNASTSVQKWYINGNFFDTYTDTFTLGNIENSSEVQIGEYVYGDDGFNGSIDRVIIYDGVLEPEDFDDIPPQIRADIYPYPFYSKVNESIRAQMRLRNPVSNILNMNDSFVKWYRTRTGDGTKNIYNESNHVIAGFNFDINDTGRQYEDRFDDIYGRNMISYGNANFTSMHLGKFYESYVGDGVGDYIMSEPIDFSEKLANGFTITAWIKYNFKPNINVITWLKDGTGVTKGFGFYVNNYDTNDSKLVLEYGNGTNPSTKISSTVLVPNSTWIHATVRVKSNKSVDFFINGVSAGSGVLTFNLSDFLHYTNLTIGATPSGTFSFNGSMDEVYIYDVPLNDSVILTFSNKTRRMKGVEWVLNSSFVANNDVFWAEICPVRNGDSGDCMNTSTVTVSNYVEPVRPYVWVYQTELDNIKSKLSQPIYAEIYADMLSDCNSFYTTSLVQNTTLTYPSCNYVALYVNTGCENVGLWAMRLAECFAVNGSSKYLNGTINWLDVMSNYRHKESYQRLQAAEYMRYNAVAYDLVYNNLTEFQKKRYRDAFAIDMIEMVDNDTEFEELNYDGSPNDIHYLPGKMSNWEVIVWGGFDQLVYALENSTPRYTYWDTLARDHVSNYFEYMFMDDGTYAEPYHYFEYAMSTAIPTIYVLDRRGYDMFSLFNLRGTLYNYTLWALQPFNNPNSAIPLRAPMTFNDANKKANVYTFIWPVFANVLKDPVAQWVWINTSYNASTMYNQLLVLNSFNDTMTTQLPSTNVKAVKFNGLNDFIYMKSDLYSNNAYMLGIYSGDHVYSHVHGGSGTFNLDAYGKILLGDAGVGDNSTNGPYTGLDWEYAKRSVNHNVVTIDGIGSHDFSGGSMTIPDCINYTPNGEYLCDDRIRGEITNFYTDDFYSIGEVDITKAFNFTNYINMSSDKRIFVTIWNNNAPYLFIADVNVPVDQKIHNYSFVLNSDKSLVISNVSDGFLFNRSTALMYVKFSIPTAFNWSITNTNLSGIEYDSDRLNVNYSSVNGTFVTLLYPLNNTMVKPNITSVTGSNYAGFNLGNETTVFRTSGSIISYAGFVTDAKILSFNPQTRKYFIEDATYVIKDSKGWYTGNLTTKSGDYSDCNFDLDCTELNCSIGLGNFSVDYASGTVTLLNQEYDGCLMKANYTYGSRTAQSHVVNAVGSGFKSLGTLGSFVPLVILIFVIGFVIMTVLKSTGLNKGGDNGGSL